MAPKFVAFVRSVEGRLVGRWDVGSAHYFGARLGSNDERAADQPIVWDTEQVIPLTQEFVVRFGRELGRALRLGDLLKATEPEYTAWLAIEAKRDETAEAERKTAKAPAEKAVAPPAPASPAPQPAPDAEPKAEKRK